MDREDLLEVLCDNADMDMSDLNEAEQISTEIYNLHQYYQIVSHGRGVDLALEAYLKGTEFYQSENLDLYKKIGTEGILDTIKEKLKSWGTKLKNHFEKYKKYYAGALATIAAVAAVVYGYKKIASQKKAVDNSEALAKEISAKYYAENAALIAKLAKEFEELARVEKALHSNGTEQYSSGREDLFDNAGGLIKKFGELVGSAGPLIAAASSNIGNIRSQIMSQREEISRLEKMAIRLEGGTNQASINQLKNIERALCLRKAILADLLKLASANEKAASRVARQCYA